MELSLDVSLAFDFGPADQILAAAEGALYERASAILADSQEHYVPVHDAILKGSGFVEHPTRTGTEIAVRFGYGGPAEDYALAVHQHGTSEPHDPPSWQGKDVHFSPAGHGPEYLSKPAEQALETLGADLAAAIRARLGA